MARNHPFTTKVEADLLKERRFRWTVVEGGQIHMRSPLSYATYQEAEEADQTMANLAARWSDPRTYNFTTL
jgi:hypothetical protein